MIKIRKGQIYDSKEIAKVHINCWETTYRGIMPDNILNSQNYEKCERKWIRYFNQRDDTSIMLVAVNENNKIIGFCTGGLNRETSLSYRFKGELTAIYIEQNFQNQGIGKNLMLKFVQNLIERDINSMIICVLEKNKSKGFYKKLGGIKITNKVYQFGEKSLTGAIYGWDNLHLLINNFSSNVSNLN